MVFWVVVLTGFLNNIVTFLLPVSIGEFFVLYFNTGSSKDKLLQWLGISLHSLDQFFIFFVALLVMKALLTFGENYMTSTQGELFVKGIRESVFTAQMQWSQASWLNQSYGKYLLRYSNDMKSIQAGLTKGYMEGLRSSLFLITGLLVLARINWQVTLVLFVFLMIGLQLMFRITHWQSAFIMSSRSARSSLLAYVSRQFSRIKKVKDLGTENLAIAGFKEKSELLYKDNMIYNISESYFLMLVPALVYGMIGVMLSCMILFEGEINAAEGVMMVLILIMMEGGIRRLLKVPSYINKGNISLRKVDKLYEGPPVQPVLEKMGNY